MKKILVLAVLLLSGCGATNPINRVGSYTLVGGLHLWNGAVEVVAISTNIVSQIITLGNAPFIDFDGAIVSDYTMDNILQKETTPKEVVYVSKPKYTFDNGNKKIYVYYDGD